MFRQKSDQGAARDIAATMTAATGNRYRPLWAGSTGALGLLIRTTRLVTLQRDAPFPAWQGTQYMRDMFSGRGKLHPLNNDRYPGFRWTKIREQLATADASAWGTGWDDHHIPPRGIVK